MERRQRLLLALLGLVLVWFAARLVIDAVRPPDDLRRVLRGDQRVASEVASLEVQELRMADLEAGAAEFRPGRDPWRFGSDRPPPPPPPPPRPVELPQQAPPPPPPPPPAVDVPVPPPVDVVYLGSFGPSARRIAVFSDEEAIYNARMGDTVKGKFQVHNIGLESVDLTFVGFPETPPKRLAVGG